MLRLVTFFSKTCRENRIGAIVDKNKIIDLNVGYASYLFNEESETRYLDVANALMPSDMLEFLDGGSRTIERARLVLDFVKKFSGEGEQPIKDPSGRAVEYRINEVLLKSPIPRPRGVGIGYFNDPGIIEEAARIEGGTLAVPAGTTYPKKAAIVWGHPGTVIGPDEPIIYPKICAQRGPRVFSGVELGIVIGKTAYKVPLDQAKHYIAGYTIAIDVTAYDLLAEDIALYALTRVKDMPTFWPIGPCIVLADQIGDVNNLQLSLRVNGEERMTANTKDYIFDPLEYVRDLSEYMILEPGTVIAMGSFKDTTTNCFVKPGDIVESEIENIGILRNPVIAEE